MVLRFKNNTIVIDEYSDGQPEQYIYYFDNAPSVIPKYAYIHIATLNNWFELFQEIIERIISSGLYDNLKQIRLGFLGSDQNLERVQNYIADKQKCVVHVRGTDLKAYERITLHALRADAVNEDFYALYLHTKGVTKYGTVYYGPVKDWVDCMHHFTITRYQDTFKIFDTSSINATGCIYKRKPKHHYSGNIWWAKSSYIRTISNHIGSAYLDPEMWIMSGRGEFIVLYDSPEVGYKKRHPANKYVDKPIEGTIIRI